MQMGRRFAARIALVTVASLAAIVVAMTAAEMWVRLAWDARKGKPGFYVSDPVRGIRLGENYSGWFAGVPVHINSLGLRDPREYDLAKKPTTFRILVLGDSVTFGHGSVYEHTYPYLIEQRLKAWRPDIDWQVWNAAVPGYNTSQELAHLIDVGPRFQPDLVVVGFYENDLIGNRPPIPPTLVRRATSGALTFLRRHVYSVELYRRIYLQLAWRLSASNDYRLRVQNLAAEDELISAKDTSAIKEQAITRYDWLSDEQVRDINCVYGMGSDPSAIEAMKREPGYDAWFASVRGFSRLHAEGAYRIVFLLNLVPRACPDGDVFYPGGTDLGNDFFVRTFSAAAPTVSCHDTFLHVRPSQMPGANGHSIGNSNAVKADAFFTFLRDSVLPAAVPAALRARGSP